MSIKQTSSGIRRSCVSADLDTAAILEANVEDGDVRLGQRDPFQRLGRRCRLTDDLDVVVGLEQEADSLPDHLMVVEEEDADHHPAIVPVPQPRACTSGFAAVSGWWSPDTIRAVPYHRISDPEKLGRLMDAVLMIEADIELPVLLGHLVEEARALVGARYGALGVLNEARTGLEQFLTAGLSESEERAIGPRPTGRGVLGLLITRPCAPPIARTWHA